MSDTGQWETRPIEVNMGQNWFSIRGIGRHHGKSGRKREFGMQFGKEGYQKRAKMFPWISGTEICKMVSKQELNTLLYRSGN